MCFYDLWILGALYVVITYLYSFDVFLYDTCEFFFHSVSVIYLYAP